MSFITLAYILFLAVACLVYYILPRATRSFWLLACSYAFYLYDPANAGFVVFLLVATGITYVAGLALDFLRGKSVWLRRVFVLAPLCFSMGSLLYYKNYFVLLSKSWCALVGKADSGQTASLAVPLGISYFLFAATGYVIDVYRGKYRAERNPLYYALFVSFFPCMMAGPIERGDHIIPQFKALHSFDYHRVTGGMFRILWGFFKKMVVANTLYEMIKSVYSYMDRYNGPMLLLASLAFSFYLYCDFAALCDIAIGSAAAFGFELTENFKRPLAAPSYTDLWRRWHISLSSWFRDYLYFPLGGSRKGRARAALNQIIVFSVSGLWHGAGLGYLVWGLLNGVYLVAGKETAAIRAKLAARNPLYYFKPVKAFLQACVTYLLFTSCMVFFAAEMFAAKGTSGITSGLYLYGHLFTGWGELFSNFKGFTHQLVLLGFKGLNAWVLAGSIVLIEGLEWVQEPVDKLIRKMPLVLRWPLYYALLLLIAFFSVPGQSFAYQAY